MVRRWVVIPCIAGSNPVVRLTNILNTNLLLLVFIILFPVLLLPIILLARLIASNSVHALNARYCSYMRALLGLACTCMQNAVFSIADKSHCCLKAKQSKRVNFN